MAKQPHKHGSFSHITLPGGLSGLAMFDGKLAECYARAGQAFITNAFRFNQEILRFATERFNADIEAVQSLARCNNWSEVANCQTSYARLAAEAYEKEARKLTEFGTDTTTETLAPLREAAEKFSEDTAKA